MRHTRASVHEFNCMPTAVLVAAGACTSLLLLLSDYQPPLPPPPMWVGGRVCSQERERRRGCETSNGMQANDTPAEGLSHEWKQPAKEIDQVRVISFGAKVKSVCVCVCTLMRRK